MAVYSSSFALDVPAWLAQLQPASWRGLGFAVDSSSYRRGRRVAVHEYPFRDEIWVEDIGRNVRAVQFSGFVVGDDCYAQAQALLEASETAGSGQLIHPSLGSLTVALTAPMEAIERKEMGRVVEIRFEFLETGVSIYPDSSTSTTDVANMFADDADTATTGDFLSGIGPALTEGAQVVSAGLRVATQAVARVRTLAGDASLITGAVAGLTGQYGRYASGSRGTILAGISNVEGALSAVTVARAGVAQAGNTVANLAGSLSL
ncbi:DNA circularization N-terminal domain-containing protein [Lichenicola cladoniae]|uniref:DNA circularization N-terminal domain-containing protein n=1 Tax=Lichenicola cladoniae TaxID=1484109 RepID=A0A6M8HNA0_9PROT|nr:DNA circularization N-terminal domain-containing protein [Lichenicola cladoniae]NPD67304.1 DNA circularization N-terminal domain-containing protein [Acetobacteraceae bacterium]QKE89806.1 DNA circularization N-terminal domain-containing protein [Lichenicola cladoniae]